MHILVHAIMINNTGKYNLASIHGENRIPKNSITGKITGQCTLLSY